MMVLHHGNHSQKSKSRGWNKQAVLMVRQSGLSAEASAVCSAEVLEFLKPHSREKFHGQFREQLQLELQLLEQSKARELGRASKDTSLWSQLSVLHLFSFVFSLCFNRHTRKEFPDCT